MNSSQDLANQLLSLPNKPFCCSVSLDNMIEDGRCFGDFTGEINDIVVDEYVLLFDCGELNNTISEQHIQNKRGLS